VIELFIGTLAAFLISGAALMLGQWFDGCGLPDCCRLREEQPRR
jgi:sugar phosphate permease